MKFNCALWVLLLSLFMWDRGYAQGMETNPMIYQLRNYEQLHAEKGYDELEIPISAEELVSIAGEKYYACYRFKKTSGVSKNPDANQILRSYYDRIVSLRGTPVYKGNGYGTFRLKSNGREYWAAIEVHNTGESYTLAVVSREKLQQADNAQDMLAWLKENGSLELYFTFSVGSANLSKASKSNIEEVAKLMRYNPTMKVSLEGHSDAVGSAADNKRLSLERANEVKVALIKLGVDPNRLSTKGWGSEKPIADNTTEQGRLKNRRVTFVPKS